MSRVINAIIDIQNQNNVLTEEDLLNLKIDNDDQNVTVTDESKKITMENVIIMHNAETNMYTVLYRRYTNQVNNAVKTFVLKNGDVWYNFKTFEMPRGSEPYFDKFIRYVSQHSELKKHFQL